eukprot:CAMPEP_0114262070 /NCGR_PEP_ID=MMETSP0058-20121206/21551_1 /TAXON_ID=36894 /ORGANISM="Pyramimonas parkeae, CCMP726" /LENGTH=145 /DNA_ID=CAMNT_0001377801 /DNA_START=308 /DNA_END=742 /DNA_ORIENTATION=-
MYLDVSPISTPDHIQHPYSGAHLLLQKLFRNKSVLVHEQTLDVPPDALHAAAPKASCSDERLRLICVHHLLRLEPAALPRRLLRRGLALLAAQEVAHVLEKPHEPRREGYAHEREDQVCQAHQAHPHGLARGAVEGRGLVPWGGW